MALFIRKSLYSISKSFIPQFQRQQAQQIFSLQPNKPISNSSLSKNHLTTCSIIPKPPFESNIIRIIRNELDYQSEYAPPLQPVTKFEAFTVENRPGEHWITLRGKYGGDEHVKLEATMFDGYENTGSVVKLHISLLVDISKGDGSDLLEFACSAWPDRLEIQKVYVFSPDGALAKPYTGPNFSDLDNKLKSSLREFLKARGVHKDLSLFLHEYMMNKDRIELIQWFRNLQSFMDK